MFPKKSQTDPNKNAFLHNLDEAREARRRTVRRDPRGLQDLHHPHLSVLQGRGNHRQYRRRRSNVQSHGHARASRNQAEVATPTEARSGLKTAVFIASNP